MIQRTFCTYVYQKSSSCLKLKDNGIHFVKFYQERADATVLLFSQWFILSGMRAKGRQTLCRTWSRTEQSLPCHTTSSSFTSNSKFPNNLQRDAGNGGIQKRVRVCMNVKEVRGRSKDSPAVALHLSEGKLLSKTASLKSMMERDRTDSDAYLALFFCAESSY